MIWGEVVNAVRSLHLELVDQFQIQPKSFLQDIELSQAKNFPFPQSGANFDEWDWITLPSVIQDALEMHSVERALIEGPLLPIEEVRIQNEKELNEMREAIFGLEVEWLEKMRLNSPDIISFIDQSLKLKWLKIQTRAGLNRLKAV